MVNDILKEAEDKMKKSIEVMKSDLGTMRAGRANPALISKVKVDYYGVPTLINQMANISVPDPRTIAIQPWDATTLKDIEKALQNSDIGINPNNDGKVIRLVVPQLTEERRRDLVKQVAKKGEEEKVAIRNIRRAANEDLKDAEKESMITEDESKKGLEKVQDLTDKYIKVVDELLKEKEKEIMEV